jgi:hypothetical protein
MWKSHEQLFKCFFFYFMWIHVYIKCLWHLRHNPKARMYLCHIESHGTLRKFPCTCTVYNSNSVHFISWRWFHWLGYDDFMFLFYLFIFYTYLLSYLSLHVCHYQHDITYSHIDMLIVCNYLHNSFFFYWGYCHTGVGVRVIFFSCELS